MSVSDNNQRIKAFEERRGRDKEALENVVEQLKLVGFEVCLAPHNFNDSLNGFYRFMRPSDGDDMVLIVFPESVQNLHTDDVIDVRTGLPTGEKGPRYSSGLLKPDVV